MKSSQLINPKKIPHPWNQVIDSSQSLHVYVVQPIFSQDYLDAVNYALNLSSKPWLLGIHWFYKKKFDRHHKLPCSPKMAKLTEPVGDYVWSLVELASEVHAMGHPLSAQWANAGQWVSQIIEEIRNQELPDGLNRMLDLDGKKPVITRLKNFLKALKEHENPCDQHTQPAYWALIDLTLKYLNMPNFKRRHWVSHHKKIDIYTCKGLIASLSSYIALLEAPNSQAIKIKNNSVFVSTNKGEVCIKAS